MKEQIDVLITKEQVEQRISELAQQISKDYEGKELYTIGILKGSVIFMSELVKKITVPLTMNFMKASSYGDSTVTSGNLKISLDLEESIEGKEVLIIEDIIDTGTTLTRLKNNLKDRKAASVKICTLLDKPDRRTMPVSGDYTGFKVPDQFVVGYGLDYAQRYRNLDFIGVLSFIEE